jgi:hypothetical protein
MTNAKPNAAAAALAAKVATTPASAQHVRAALDLTRQGMAVG